MTTCQGIDVYPYVFLRVLTIFWHFQAPFNFYAFYCIVFVSPKIMKSFRWHLLLYQCSTTFLDFTFSMGMTPVVIPAMPLGYTVGLFRGFLNCHQMLTLSLICMTTSASTTVEIFFWRWQNIILPSSSLKLRTITYYGIWLFALSLLFSSLALIHIHLDSDQMLLRFKLQETYSCADFLFQQPGVYICEASRYMWVVIYGVISCSVGGFFLVLFVYQSLHAINQMASNRSVHARNVQKKLIYLLCAQMMFPMGAYAIGGTTIVISLSMQLVWMQHIKSRKKNSAIVRVIDRSVVLT
ncbi:Protein CBG22803 [Caenorhabditis briggsae]|uniref:Protein CBG22803 n=1 Tax=Caenorhabditis briggsae TaxID=6238 RepID=A8Y2X2_CAEBR|nr:Protein CBG22803 [Caenorhabditis briggsae]CAP39306.2 Protein CBG22803 [Caenorhabditis briggsae]